VNRFSILIADDDTANRDTLAGLLADRGFETVTAADGKDAVRVFQASPAHLCLFDMHMPRLSGLAALKLLRKLTVAPAILMTANNSRQLVADATDAGAFAVLDKPVDKAFMLETLNLALSRAYPAFTPIGEGLR
jgi:two-component system, response regulator PdtaR